MPENTTRGRSYTNFPRNTKARFLKACAEQAAEVEKAYQEYAPKQVANAKEMRSCGSIGIRFTASDLVAIRS